jgi:hypothetical protein
MALGKYLHCVLLTVFLRKASADALISILLVIPRLRLIFSYNALIFCMKCRFFSVSPSELSVAKNSMNYFTPLNSTKFLFFLFCSVKNDLETFQTIARGIKSSVSKQNSYRLQNLKERDCLNCTIMEEHLQYTIVQHQRCTVRNVMYRSLIHVETGP